MITLFVLFASDNAGWITVPMFLKKNGVLKKVVGGNYDSHYAQQCAGFNSLSGSMLQRRNSSTVVQVFIPNCNNKML